MRMRRKKNLDMRISNCSHLLMIENSDFYSKSEDERYSPIDIVDTFNNSNPLWLELGCGKGKFAVETALKNPNINIIGVEKISNVIVEACERDDLENVNNCYFLNCGVENLKYYLPEKCVEKIFLNFSCPFPKNTYENRRLTYYRFLNLYKKLLKNNGTIILKTDSRKFFEYSLQSFSENGFIIKNISLDLHSDDLGENIETEYENIFVSKGLKIYKAEAYLIEKI